MVMTKKLKVNDILFAEYEIENNVLFLKQRVKSIAGMDTKNSENFCIALIQHIENRTFLGASYLNIP